MGLDMTAYSNLEPMPIGIMDGAPGRVPDDVEYPSDFAWDMGGVCFYLNDGFEGTKRSTPLEERIVYGYEDKYGFRAGSYSGYNWWRDELAKMTGLPEARAMWGEFYDESHPFAPLINYSDCEGTIGPVVSARLYQDFMDWEDAAREHAEQMGADGRYFLDSYGHWMHGFSLAAQNGAMCFH